MKEFQLTALVTISIYTKVEAENLEEAIKIGEEREEREDIESSEFSQDDEQEKRAWVSDDFDGMPQNVKES